MSIALPNLEELGIKAREAAVQMAQATTDQKNKVIHTIAELLENQAGKVLAANAMDIRNAVFALSEMAMIDRLSLQGRIHGIAKDIRKLAELPDPIGEVFDTLELPNGLKISKRRVPIGVLGIIYESRPNVTVEVAALTIKTGNCAILRGGSETIHSNRALVEIIKEGLKAAQLPENAIQFIDSSDRSLVKEMLLLHKFIDLIIPRGGAKLHDFCRENSKIPVITGGIGICHLYVEATANQEKAVDVVFNAKTQRPTVCNALDTVLVDENLAKTFLPKLVKNLGKAGVSFRVDSKALKIVKKLSYPISLAEESKDWDTEWLNLTLGIKVVKDLNEAIAHIQKHSSGHSDGILTENPDHAARFLHEVDSAAVYVNASTRFTDGGQMGLGAEVAISTQKIHARGPMGLQELTSYKWVIIGNYHVRP